MKKKSLKCPYCGGSVGFVSAFQSKANEEYFCQFCSNFSQVKIRASLKNLATFLAILVAIVVVIFSLFLKFYIMGTALVFLLFVAFYLQVPRFIVLKKKKED